MSWKAIQKFFRENPRAWFVAGAAVLTLVVATWAIWGGASVDVGNLLAEEYCTPGDHSQPAVQRLTIKVFFVEGYDTPPSSIPLDAVVHFDATGKMATGNCLTDGSSDVVWSITPSDGGEIRPRGGNPFTPILRTIKNGTYQVSATLDGIRSNTLTITVGSGGGGGACPVPTAVALPATLTVTCGATQNILRWQNPLTLRASVNSVLRSVNGATGSFVFTEGGCWNTFGIGTYTDTNVQAGQTYSYRVKTSASVVSNEVVCTGSGPPAPTATPLPTATPTPVYPPLQCAPINQTVALNQNATVNASGGSGVYEWLLSGSGVQQGGTATSVDVSYSVSGQKVVRVSSAGQIATCVVSVPADSTPGGSPSTITVTKRGINTFTGSGIGTSVISVNSGESAQFTVSITNNGTTMLDGLRVTDSVPGGMTYILGSTTVNGQVSLENTITTSGLALGSLAPGTNVSVQWSAAADATFQLAAGPQQFQPMVLVTANGIPDATTNMIVTVYGSGFAPGSGTFDGSGSVDASGNFGTVATGPAEAVTIALVMAAALTLLYSGYTRSAAYRHREADTVSRDQGPMDFRS